MKNPAVKYYLPFIVKQEADLFLPEEKQQQQQVEKKANLTSLTDFKEEGADGACGFFTLAEYYVRDPSILCPIIT